MLAAPEGNTKIGTLLLDRGADVAALNNLERAHCLWQPIKDICLS